MSRSEVAGAATRGSARLGLTLRSVLLSPRDGFTAALKTEGRRARIGRRPAQGWTPYVLAFLGGAAVASLWLKVGALAGVREICSPRYVTGHIVFALVLGGLFGLLGQALWGAVGSALATALHAEAGRGSLRLIWGAAHFPLVVGFLVLLPLDLLIVGRDTFTTSRLADPLSTAWAAFSIAVGISLAVWSLFLAVKGVEVASSVNAWKAIGMVAAGLVCLVALVTIAGVAGSLVAEVRSCPTTLG